MQIAIDGPSGAGKSTIAKALANVFHFTYIDTGAMYRAVGLFALQHNIDVKENPDALIERLDDIQLTIRCEDKQQRIFLNGSDVSDQIRVPQVSIAASNVAVIPAVRLKLVELQRMLAAKQNVIMDGRDVGTYILPDADIKIFLTATVEDRAARRYAELLQRKTQTTYEAVLEDMKYRDKNDSSRAFAPLKPAKDALIVDTTGNTLEQSIELLKKLIETKKNEEGK